MKDYKVIINGRKEIKNKALTMNETEAIKQRIYKLLYIINQSQRLFI